MGNILIPVLLLIVGLFVGAIIAFIIMSLKKKSEQYKASSIIEKAKKEAEKAKRDALLDAKEETYKLKLETEKEIKEKKEEIKSNEERLLQRESSIDRRDGLLQNREQMLDEKENSIIKKQKEIQKLEEKAENVIKEQIEKLEKISGFSKKQAKEEIMKQVELSMSKEIASFIKEKEAEAKMEVDKKAKNLLVESMEKYASDVTNEQTVSVVNLPNDDMKGRIIGREGRNIRTIEAVTGVDLIIDDTPEAVILSSFDPIRREVARIALEKLIVDGRIHPARIEEMVERAKKDVENDIKEEGEQATLETGVHGLHPEIIRLLGRLKYRTSYGQNVLKHSIEVSYLASVMASELGLDVNLAKRAGLLHDIGKAIDQEQEGPHALIGGDFAKKYHESALVVNAISAHHGDVEMMSMEAVLVQAADAISAARPGARRETLEAYIKRLEKLEEIANSYEGVDKSYAIQAGREIRIMVKPEQLDDAGSVELARNLAKSVEEQLEYPGQIKINVIREIRAVDFAK